MSKIQSKITETYESVIDFYEKRCRPQYDPDVVRQRLQTGIITMLYEVKVNTLEMKGKTEVLSREIVTIKRTKWKHKNPNSKIPEILKITV